jgi:hypothetical protein
VLRCVHPQKKDEAAADKAAAKRAKTGAKRAKAQSVSAKKDDALRKAQGELLLLLMLHVRLTFR